MTVVPGAPSNFRQRPLALPMWALRGWAALAIAVVGLALAEVAAAQTAATAPVPMMGLPGNASSVQLVDMPLLPNAGTAPTAGPSFSRQSGLNVVGFAELGTAGGAYGYIPFRIVVTARTAATKDRALRLRISVGGWRGRGRDIEVEQTFNLPAGATTGVYRMLVPRISDWQWGTWSTWVDGRQDEQLSTSHFAVPNSGSVSTATVLSVGNSPTFGSGLDDLANEGYGVPPGGYGGGGVVHEFVQPQDLPQRWLEYTSIDLVSLDSRQLIDLAANHPQRMQALRLWIRSGGSVWVADWNAKGVPLADIQEALGIEIVESERGWLSGEGEPLPRGWRPAPVLAENDNALQGLLALQRQPPRDDQAEATPGAILNRLSRAMEQFLVRPHGMGLVVLIPERNSLQQTAPGMGGMTNEQLLSRSVAAARLSWEQRHGFAPNEGCKEFNNWLIPGVGTAPVTMFQVLITLFVIAVGPVNYWLLARRRRLTLLLVTAPAAALAAVSLLFAYGLVTDGLGTRVRARSVTLLDQRAGQAATWARLSYYAGLAPSGGLTLPDDVAVYPLLPDWAVRRSQRGGMRRRLDWDEQQQRLVQGWLPSRTPTQLMTVASRPATGRLVVREGDQGVQVENRLGVDVTALALQDGQGRLYWADGVARDELVRLTPVDWATIATKLRSVFSENQPQYAAGSEPEPSRMRYGYYNNAVADLSQGLLELHLAAMIEPTVRELGDRSYVAVTAHGLGLDLGRPDDELTEEASFHVVRGTW